MKIWTRVKDLTKLFNSVPLFASNNSPKGHKTQTYNVITSTGNVSPERSVPSNIPKPIYYSSPSITGDDWGLPKVKSEEEIQKMRKSCKLAANILQRCESMIKVGVTTDAIDEFVHNEIIKAEAYPSPLRYLNFPKSVCTSVNNVACHGIPDDRPLQDGDIINVDITVYLNGYHGDCSRTYLVGNVSEEAKRLVELTENCVIGAITKCGPGRKFNVIGKHIDDLAKKNGVNIIPVFIGHGIGTYFHGSPEILHFYNEENGEMQPGLTFTIEPILSLGSNEVEIHPDGWTVTTTDDSLTAQFEHTILITNSGVEILTLPDNF